MRGWPLLPTVYFFNTACKFYLALYYLLVITFVERVDTERVSTERVLQNVHAKALTFTELVDTALLLFLCFKT